MDVQTNDSTTQGVPQRDSVVSRYSYKESPLLRKAITRKIDPKIRTVQKRLGAVRNLEEETMDKHSDEKPRVDTLEEEKNDQARVVATMSNDATENSDIVGVGGRASDGSKAAPVPGRGRRDIKKWKKARQEKAKRDRSRSRKEQRSRSDWSEDSYDEESDAIGGLLDYFGGNEDLYSEYTEETGSTNGDFIGHMFSDSKRGRNRVDIPELLMEQFGCLEEYDETDAGNEPRGKGSKKKKSSAQPKDEGKSVPEKVIINEQADDDERGIKSTLTFDYVPESACSERLHIFQQLSHKLVDMVCDAWDKTEPSDETVKTMGDIEVQSQAALSVLSAASEKSYKKLTAASEQGYKTLSSASEKGFQTLKALVEQARVASRKGDGETKEDDGVKVGDDKVVTMGGGSGVEVGQVKVDASTDDEMAKMKLYLSNVHNGFMEAIGESAPCKSPVNLPDYAGMQEALPCKSPVNCPDDEAAIQDSVPCKLPATLPENGVTTQTETPALADQIVDDVEAEPVLVDKFVDELESGISIPSCTSKLEDDAQESEENSASDIETPNKKDQNLDEPEEHVESANSRDSENVQKEEAIDELGTKFDEKATVKTPETSPGSSPASTPARNSSKNKKVKTPKKGRNPLKRIFRILRPAKLDSKFKRMDATDVDSSQQQIPSEERFEATPIRLKFENNEKGEEEPSPKKALPKVIIRPLSEDMDDTEKLEAPNSGRATLTTEGGSSSPRLSVPRENPNPRNRHKKATDEGNPKPTQSTPTKVAEDKKVKVATWDSPMFKDDPANNESAWYKQFVEWDSEVPAEGAQEEMVGGEAAVREAQGNKNSRESLRPENRQQSNEVLNDSSSTEQGHHQVRSPLSGAEERDCPTGHDDKPGGQTWYKEFSEWDQGGAASPLGQRNRSTDSNSSPADVSRFDHATHSAQQGQKEKVDQINVGTSDGPDTAGEF